MARSISYIKEFIDLFFPRTCVVCQKKLLHNEQYLCFYCLNSSPTTNHINVLGNELEQQLSELFNVERAIAYLEYHKDSPYRFLVHQLKYDRQVEIGEILAYRFGLLLKDELGICNADYLCPVPLHPAKEKKRGYNQSFHIALGLSKALQIPILNDVLIRNEDSKSQTKRNREERLLALNNTFECISAQKIEGKHIILIDDVITTGATLTSCTYAIMHKCNAKISVLALAFA